MTHNAWKTAIANANAKLKGRLAITIDNPIASNALKAIPEKYFILPADLPDHQNQLPR